MRTTSTRHGMERPATHEVLGKRRPVSGFWGKDKTGPLAPLLLPDRREKQAAGTPYGIAGS